MKADNLLTPRELRIIQAHAQAAAKAEAEQRRKERELAPQWVRGLASMLTKWTGL